MNHLTVVTEDAFASLLELAANNDVERFKQSIEREPSGVDEIGQWYGRQKGSKQMVLEYRTPLMVAATYGSIDVMKLILSLSDSDVNRFCGLDKSTALHCAASGGSVNAVDVVKLLLLVGADPNSLDANGHRPVDVLVVPPKLQDVKATLEELLATNGSSVERNLSISTGQTEIMEKWYEKFRNFGIEPETRTFNISIGAYGKKRMYDKMSSDDGEVLCRLGSQIQIHLSPSDQNFQVGHGQSCKFHRIS
ncbi:hypothetical protein AAG906_012452 [Vitis piasezkii]